MSDNDNINGLVIPHDTNAEKALIGAILKDEQVLGDVESIVYSADFYNKQLGQIYDVMQELNDEKTAIDIVTVASRLKEKGVPDEVTSIDFIRNILESVPVSANARVYAQIVKESALRRNVIKASQEMMNESYSGTSGIDALMNNVESRMMKLIQTRDKGDYVPIRQVVIDTMERINAASKAEGSVTGVPSGFTDLDYKTSGFQNSDLILVAARPSMGKTAFVLNIAHHVVVKEHLGAVIFSLEMSKEQLMTRFLSQDAMVDSKKLRNGNLTNDEWGRLAQSADTIAKTKLIIDDTSSISINELRTKCRKYKLDYDIGIIIIDYLQLMTGNSREGRQNEVSEISRALKGLARELNVPVIALSQLSRAVESREDKKPMLSDLRESGAIEQDADVVMFIYREDYYKKDTDRRGIADIIIAKQRNGPVGSIELAWLPDYTRFANHEVRREGTE